MEKDSSNIIDKWYIENRLLYKKLAYKIESILEELIEESGINIHAIYSRAKSLDSFIGKVKKKNYKQPKEDIHDLAGIRVICYVETDVVKVSELIRKNLKIDQQNSVDKKKELGVDKVGYQSVHFVAELGNDRLGLSEYKKYANCKFEIQVRTILQHAWAEIEHDRNYKFTGVLPDEVKRRFTLLAGNLEMADREFNLIALEIDKIQANIDQGELNLPLNSTTLKQYLSKKLENLKDDFAALDFFQSNDIAILNELKGFGISTLKELDEFITDEILGNYEKLSDLSWHNFSSFLQNLMLITDYNKYFEKSWEHSVGPWDEFGKAELPFLRFYHVPVEDLAEKYNLRIEE